MPISIGVSGAHRTTTWRIGVDGVWRSVAGIWIGVGGTWRPCSAKATLSVTSDTESNTTAGNTFSPNLTVNISGGTATSYNWVIVSSTGGTWTFASGQGTSSAAVRVGGVPLGTTVSAVIRCDAVVAGVTISSNTATYTYNRT